MMKPKWILTALLFGMSIAKLSAQQPKIMPTSPEASALSKLVNFPVSLNTGVPNINIPFYQIQDKEITVPIGISYHAGGFKINEQSTSVGLGWSLDSDIGITRTVNGMDDFKPTVGYLANTNMRAYYENFDYCPSCAFPLGSTYFYDAQIATGGADGAPDRFSYKLANKSGSFYFRKSDNGTGYSIVPVPYDDIKIQYNSGQFVITDTDGTIYYFGTSGVAYPSTAASMGVELSGGINIFNNTCNNCSVTGWKCTKIQNATNTAQVTFAYQAKTLLQYTNGSESIEYYDNLNPCSYGGSYLTSDIPQTTAGMDYTTLINSHPFWTLPWPKYMEKTASGSIFHIPYAPYNSGTMSWSSTFVDQTYGGGISIGTDLGESNVLSLAPSSITFNGGSVQFSGTDKIDSISVINSSSQKIKTIALISSYATSPDMTSARLYNGSTWNGTLYLDSVRVRNNNINYERYMMYYNKYCFGSHLKGRDAWGFVNAATKDISLSAMQANIPKQSVTQFYHYDTYAGCTNGVNHTFTFGAAANIESPDQNASQKGMLQRIVYPTGGYADFDFENNMAKITSFTNAKPSYMVGGLRIRSITYWDGKNNKPVSQKYYRYGELEDGLGVVVNSLPRQFNSGVFTWDAFHYNQTVSYFFGPTSGTCQNASCMILQGQEIKTTYQPSSSLDYTYSSGSPIYYTRVTEYNSDMGAITGKKVYNYYDPDYFVPATLTYNNLFYGTNIPIIKSDGFFGMEKSETEYKYENQQYLPVHKKEFDYKKWEQSGQPRVVYSFLRNICQVASGGVYSGGSDGLYNTSVSGGWQGRSSDYQSGQYGIKVGKLLLTGEREKWFTNTDSTTIARSYYYDNPNYLQVSRIVTINSDGHHILETIKRPYDYGGTSVYDQMKAANRINDVIEDIKFDSTANAELTHVKSNYASFTTGPGFIAKSSEQASVKGNALENTITYDVYDVKANPVQVTGRDGVPKTYLWGYNYKYPVAEILGANYSQVSTIVNYPTLQTVVVDSSLRSTLTSVRANLPNAMVSSSTYKLLTGVSSQTAPNGLNKYYDYDGISRLMRITDHNKKVISQYTYNETGPGSILALPGYVVSPSVPVMATFSALCGSGGTYKSWNYVETGGKFTSTSAALANSSAESALFSTDGPAASAGIPCPVGQMVHLSLVAFMYTGSAMPSNAYMDLFQNKHIVASQKFPYNSGSTDFYVSTGNYQLGFRLNENFNLSILEYYVQPSTGSGFYARSGDAITFSPGITYTITVSNSLMP